MSAAGRLVLVQYLAALAQRPDQRIAVPVFNALEVITHEDPSPRTLVDSATLEKLTTAYRALVKSGSLLKSQTLETGLGMQ